MYLKQIEIKNLWGKDFSWKLHEDVNVLIGENGSGKSTILQMIHEAVLPIPDTELNFRLFDPIDELIIQLENDIVIQVNSENRTITGTSNTEDYHLNIGLIDTFDVVEKSRNPSSTLLDYELEKLKLKFVTYQRDLSAKVEEAFRNSHETSQQVQLEEIQDIYKTKNTFTQILNKLFTSTQKRFDEKEFHFLRTGIQAPILPTHLSSGEKQILIILLTALLQDRNEFVLLMDEPEISLHIDWQRSLLKNIREINPACQVILATHSPTVYYQGWIEKIARIEEMLSESVESVILEQRTARPDTRLEDIKKEFHASQENKLTKIYQFNQFINYYTSFKKQECIELLDFLHEKKIYPDAITFMTLIAKLNTYEDAKAIFDLMEQETYSQLAYVKPTTLTLNTLVKKVPNVKTGLRLIQEINNHKKIQLYPDIITFSTLLGKAKTTQEIRLLEDARNYYGVKMNKVYSNKLKLKK